MTKKHGNDLAIYRASVLLTSILLVILLTVLALDILLF